MSTGFCPTCRQHMTVTRNGVRMTSFKARMFDLIKQRGDTGISVQELNAIMYDGKARPVTIRTHVYQLNELLMDTGTRIDGNCPGNRGFYVMYVRKVSRETSEVQPCRTSA